MMRINKKTIVVGVFLLIAVYCVCAQVIVYNLSDMEREDGENTKPYVAVITKSTTSDFWEEVESGVSAAAAEYNMQVTFDGPDNEEDYETQNMMIEEAVEEGAQVIVLSAVDYNANAQAVDDAIAKGVQVISIDSDVNSDGVLYNIGTDNYLAGYMAGEAALSAQDEELYIGIVNYDVNSANGQEREAGFRDAVSKDSRVVFMETINVLSTTEDAQEKTMELLATYPEINVVATFNEWTSLGVGYAIEEMGLGRDTTVVAFDNNVISVGMLEIGNVDALIVQNPFAMGYLGVEYAYNLINGLTEGQEERVDTETTLITRENMYDEVSQRVLFSFD